MDAQYDCDWIEIDEFAALSIEVSGLIASRPTKTEKYPAKTHARKVRDELGVKNGLIYLRGQTSVTWADSDTEAPFRQHRHAFYLSGADFPGIAVTYHVDKDDLILWIPIRKPQDVLWVGTLPSIEECAAKSHVDSVRDIKDLQSYLEDMLHPQKKSPTVYVPNVYSRPPPLSWERPADGLLLPVDVTHLLPAIGLARALKTPYEISQIRKAVNISSEAHRAVQKHIKSLKNEAEVENIFIAKCRELGAKKQAYNVIAGSGPNAATLHYGSNDEDFGDRQLMVLDAGCEFECYASDVTRTLPLNGHFTDEAKKIYQLVTDMQESSIAMIRPGVIWSVISENAQQVAYQGLLKIGIIQRGRVGDLPSIDITRVFFPHGLGHLVGLDTHDVIDRVHIRDSYGNLISRPWMGSSFLGKRQRWEAVDILGGGDNDRFSPPLKKDMVITCEPGIYFNKAFIEDFLSARGLDQYVNRTVLEKYYLVCGCRIEDCILVTEDGYENLTTAPKGKEMIKLITGCS